MTNEKPDPNPTPKTGLHELERNFGSLKTQVDELARKVGDLETAHHREVTTLGEAFIAHLRDLKSALGKLTNPVKPPAARPPVTPGDKLPRE